MTILRKKECRSKSCLMNEYIQKRMEYKRVMGKNSTADLYQATGHHLLAFRNGKDFPVRELTPTMVSDFQDYLQAKGLKINSVNSYMSCLRAIYNAAFNEKPFPVKIYPFRNLKLKRDITVKKPLSESMIKKLAMANFSDPNLVLATDLALFSFMAYGMPFADMVRLTQKNIRQGWLIYNRHKTGIQIRIEITPGMRRILDKWRMDSEYLFPIMFPNASHSQYKALLANYNRSLVKIGEKLGIHEHLTSYVFRYTWAAEARRLHVDISVISQAMGHTSEKTTRGYLNQLDQSELDSANRTITKSINTLLVRKSKRWGRHVWE